MHAAPISSIDRLRILTTATRVFAEGAGDYHALLERVVQHTAEVLRCFCGVTLLSEDGQQLVREAAYDTDPVVLATLKARTHTATLPLDSDAPVAQMFRRGETTLITAEELARVTDNETPRQRAGLDTLDMKTVLLAPLRVQGRIIGVLTLMRHGAARDFESEDVTLAENLGDYAALAISNARLIASERAARSAAEQELERRRRAEDARRRTEDLLEAAPDAMVIVGPDGLIRLVNGQVEKMFGYARDELLGKPVELLVPLRFRGRHPGHRAGYAIGPKTRPMGAGLDLRAVRKDGSEFPAEISLSPMHDERGTLVTAAIRDVTERKHLELKMLEASRLKSEFLANISHELRTPLNAIIGFTELLSRGKAGPLSPTQHEYLGDVLVSSRHLLQLINDVLDLAKVESGKMEFRPEPIDVARVISEVRDVLRGLFAGKHLQVHVEVAAEVATVTVDPARFKQILYNYLSNAIKFTEQDGQVSVRVQPEGPEWFRLDVEDDGIGIAQEAFAKLFIEFQQLDASTAKKYQGTGLGLALTRRIAEAHGGRVEVKSTLGEGSTFSVVLPRETKGDL